MTSAILTRPAFTAHTFPRSLAGRAAIGLVATLLIAAAAHVAIPLWFTPVPLTLQPFAVLCVGLVLGPVDGFCVLLAYLGEGAVGLPVFAPTGLGGVAQLLGPTGGFLMSYPLVAFVAGACARMMARIPRFAAGLVAATVASVLLFCCGAGWLMHLAHLTVSQTLAAAVTPFLIGGAIHIVAAATAFRALTPAPRD